MELLTFFVIGCVASWYLTWCLTSCAIIKEEGKTDWCEPNVMGPFRLYDFVRWFFRQPFIPPFVRENSDCPYCVSFWAAFFVALWLPIYSDLSWIGAIKLFFVFWLGMSGVVAFHFRRLRLLYGLDAKEN